MYRIVFLENLIVWYNDQEDFFNLIEEYLSKPEERLRIAPQGYEFVHKHHTFHHFVERVLVGG